MRPSEIKSIPAFDAPLRDFKLDGLSRELALIWADQALRIGSIPAQIRACKIIIENDESRRVVAARLLEWLEASHEESKRLVAAVAS